MHKANYKILKKPYSDQWTHIPSGRASRKRSTPITREDLKTIITLPSPIPPPSKVLTPPPTMLLLPPPNPNPNPNPLPTQTPPPTSNPYDWSSMARPSQKIPAGDWRTWMIMAGRGFGKTRTGAETIRQWVKEGTCRRIALIGHTDLDVEEVMIRGHTGLLNIHPPAECPKYSAHNHRLTWPSGAVAHTYTAHAYERLRGPQFDGAWIDELGKFENAQEVWDQLMFGMRLGTSPRVIVTTTPRPMSLLKDLQNDPTTVLTRGATYENADNLSPAFIQQILKRYEGTKLGIQEIEGHLFESETGILFQPEWIRYGTDEDLQVLP